MLMQSRRYALNPLNICPPSVECLQVKARKEAARKDEVLDNITDEQLQAIEQEFIKATADEEEAAPAAAAPGTD